MDEQTAVAAPSAAPVMEVDRGPLVNLSPDQRSEFRRTGELPKPAQQDTPAAEDAAPSTTEETPNPESEGKPEGESKPDTQKTTQETRRKPDAEHRIKNLTDENKRIKAELEALKKPADPKSEQKPAEQRNQDERPKDYKEWRSQFKASSWIEQYGKDHPDDSYEDASAAMADYLGDVRDQFKAAEQKQQTYKQEFDSKIQSAKQRYGDKFEETVAPAAKAIGEAIPADHVVHLMLNDSDMLPDLLFTLGSDPKEMESFVQMAKANPGKAIRYIALTESLIREQLEGKQSDPKPTPAKPQTQAPKPPAEVGGRAASPGDQLEAAAKANDFRSFKAEATRRQLALMKG